MCEKKDVMCFYYLLHDDLKNFFGENHEIKFDEGVRFISKSHNIKRELSKIIMFELINNKFVDKINRDVIVIKSVKKNPIGNISSWYHKMGLW